VFSLINFWYSVLW